MWFMGSMPHRADGVSMLEEMVSDTNAQDRGDDIKVNMAFSRKRPNDVPYVDYYQKVTTYIALLSGQARVVDPGCTAKIHKPPITINKSSVFKYEDMATTRSGSGAAASRLVLDRIAIIGLGGTGAYILDLVAKTHVREIHLFDGDVFESHSAFRAPGAAALDDLGKAKVDYLAEVYGKMRTGIFPHAEYVTAENIGRLDGFSFAFVAVDRPEARGVIFEGLQQRKIPFIDVGMGVTATAESRLRGAIRTTMVTPEKADHVDERVNFAAVDPNDVYTSDVQVADLNALNATLAVLRWKKLYGYYQDDSREHHSVYRIGTHVLTKEERA